MTDRNWIIGVLLTALTFSISGRAEELPALTQHMNEILDATESAVESGASSSVSVTEEAWYYRRFWLRFRPRMSFSIPGIAKLEVIPELEMLWQRDLPAGWETYTPPSNSLGQK